MIDEFLKFSDDIEEVFDLEGLSKSPSVFDRVKLNWFNAEYIRKLTPEKYLEIVNVGIFLVEAVSWSYAFIVHVKPRKWSGSIMEYHAYS